MSFWRGKRILITGANGFIGGNLTHFFVNKGAQVTGLERGIRIVPEVIKLVFSTSGNKSKLKWLSLQMQPSCVFGEISAQYKACEVVQKDLGWTSSTTLSSSLVCTHSLYRHFLSD